MKARSSLLFSGIVLMLMWSCAGTKLHLKDVSSHLSTKSDDIPDYTLYVLGDAGALNDQSRAVMMQLEKTIKDDKQPGMILFTGDNVYPAGMPPPADTQGYRHSQDILINQVNRFDAFPGPIVFIPGNHDWNEFKAGGLDAIRRQGKFLEQLNDPRIRMLPENGCGGPVILDLNEHIVMIIIDSQWWLQDWTDEAEMNLGCEFDNRDDLIKAVHQAIDANRGKQIIVAMHHPLFSQGTHGGCFTLRDHLFPLSKAVKWLYLPLPVIGSIYPYYRSVIGHPQDIRHKNYTALKRAIMNGVEDDDSLIFLAGHDHNLQYMVKGKHHFLLSGSGSKQNAVANSKDLIYGHKAPGFMQIDFYNDDSVHLTIYEVDIMTQSSSEVFNSKIIDQLAD